MRKYWFYWRRGWIALFVVFGVSVGAVLINKPLGAIFVNSPRAYFLSALISFLVLGLPWAGAVLEFFTGTRLFDDPE